MFIRALKNRDGLLPPENRLGRFLVRDSAHTNLNVSPTKAKEGA